MAGPIIRNIKLQYLNGRGRGELIRYILKYSAVPFVDERVEIADWFAKVKPTTPIGQVPVLFYEDTDGKPHTLIQSSTIARTLARWYGLAGKTDQQKAVVDETYECIRDVYDAAGRINWEPDAAKKKQMASAMKTELVPRTLNYLERRLKTNGEKVTSGDSFSYADFAVAITLARISEDILVPPKTAFREKIVELNEIEEKYPVLGGLKKSVEQHPNIAAHLASRPVTTF